MSERTPTPWRVEEGTSLIWGACTDDPSTYGMGYPIVEAKIPGWRPYKPSMEEREANAAFIIKAVNSHDALVAVAEAARSYFMYAVQDEASERECCVDDEQHRRAKALEDALASIKDPA